MTASASQVVSLLSHPLEAGCHATGLIVASFALLSVFFVIDFAVVARCMALISNGQLAGAASAFGLIVTGVLVTVWKMEERTSPD